MPVTMTTDVEETLCLPKEVSTDIQCEKPSVKKTHNAAGDPEEASRIWRKDEVEVHYRIEETPPIHFTILFALQVCAVRFMLNQPDLCRGHCN